MCELLVCTVYTTYTYTITHTQHYSGIRAAVSQYSDDLRLYALELERLNNAPNNRTPSAIVNSNNLRMCVFEAIE